MSELREKGNRGSGPERQVAIVVAHTHWDREWYATFEQFRIRLVRVIDEVVDLLEQEPQFRFFVLDGQTIVLEDYLDVRPEGRKRLVKLVRAGRLIIGPWYVLPDEFLVSAEALVRNLMLGRQSGEELGPVMKVGYVPDPFGHVAQLPQILNGFGIDSFVFSRGLGDEGEALGSEFHWLAPDGSEVLAVHQIGWDDRSTGYLNGASLGYASPWVPRQECPDLELAGRQLEELCEVLARYARTRFLLVNNGCDHLPPQRELPEILARENRTNSAERDVPSLDLGKAPVRFEQGTFEQYVESVRGEASHLGRWQGELRGSRYAPLLSGVLSTRLYLKQENDRVQSLMENWAEPWSAAAWLEGRAYPKALLWRAWRYLLQNHPHDSICGCSIDEVHEEMMGRFAKVRQIGEALAGEALEHIAGKVDVSWVPAGAKPMVVFNPLGQQCSGFVTCEVDLPNAGDQGGGCDIVTAGGRRLPCQVLGRQRGEPGQSGEGCRAERVKVGFVAEEVPAVGYRAYALVQADSGETGEGAALRTERDGEDGGTGGFPGGAQGAFVENEYYRVTGRGDGTIDIVHKPTGHSVEGALRLVDEADGGDEYTFSPLAGEERSAGISGGTGRSARARVSVRRSGPVVWTLAIDLELELPAGLTGDRKGRSETLVPCPVHWEVSLYRGIDRVEVRGTMENRAADHRVRVLVPTNVRADRVAAAGHFGVTERPVKVARSEGWAEERTGTSHQGGFVDVSDGRHGVSVIARGLPEYEALSCDGGRVALALTLLRGVGWLSRDDIKTRPGHAGPELATPGAQCVGRHSFELALQMYEGDWREGKRYGRALEHAAGMRCVEASAGGASRSLPPAMSFVTLEGDGLVLSAVKQAEDGHRLVVRVYNASGSQSVGRLAFYRRIEKAVLMRLDETVVGDVAAGEDGALAFEAPGAKVMTFGVRLREG